MVRDLIQLRAKHNITNTEAATNVDCHRCFYYYYCIIFKRNLWTSSLNNRYFFFWSLAFYTIFVYPAELLILLSTVSNTIRNSSKQSKRSTPRPYLDFRRVISTLCSILHSSSSYKSERSCWEWEMLRRGKLKQTLKRRLQDIIFDFIHLPFESYEYLHVSDWRLPFPLERVLCIGHLYWIKFTIWRDFTVRQLT